MKSLLAASAITFALINFIQAQPCGPYSQHQICNETDEPCCSAYGQCGSSDLHCKWAGRYQNNNQTAGSCVYTPCSSAKDCCDRNTGICMWNPDGRADENNFCHGGGNYNKKEYDIQQTSQPEATTSASTQTSAPTTSPTSSPRPTTMKQTSKATTTPTTSAAPSSSATTAPTTKATPSPSTSAAPSSSATTAPTTKATPSPSTSAAPSSSATTAPTTKATTSPSTSAAPSSSATTAPTTKATTSPTTQATTTPTSSPAPTSTQTSSPATSPTTKPTQKPCNVDCPPQYCHDGYCKYPKSCYYGNCSDEDDDGYSGATFANPLLAITIAIICLTATFAI